MEHPNADSDSRTLPPPPGGGEGVGRGGSGGGGACHHPDIMPCPCESPTCLEPICTKVRAGS